MQEEGVGSKGSGAQHKGDQRSGGRGRTVIDLDASSAGGSPDVTKDSTLAEVEEAQRQLAAAKARFEQAQQAAEEVSRIHADIDPPHHHTHVDASPPDVT